MSCIYLNDLFRVMFLNSTIAKIFQLSKTKCGYYINFGVAPYVRKLLKETIEILPFLTILFDESLNGYVQKEQMDIKIRFWCNDKYKVTTKYLDSKFLARGNAETISIALIKTLDGLDNRNSLMLSMDGPNTNWSVLDKVSSHCQQMELPSFFEVGCCGLYTVDGAFQTGAVATNWLLDKVLHGMWKLFKDSLARMDTYITVTCSKDFSSVFVKPAGLKMKTGLQRLLKFGLIL